MKKYLALILGVLLVLSFSATAFAIHAEIPSETQAVVAKGGTQIILGGEVRTRGWYRDHITGSKLPTATEENAFYDQRVRLSVDATVAPGVKGYVMLETGTSDTYTWGGLNYKPGALNINEAWILYTGSGLLGFNSGLKIGHMPLALGEKQFFDHTKYGDDAIVFFMDPTKQIHIGLLTFKGFEGGLGNNYDLDAYVALATVKLDDKNTAGVNFTYLNSPNKGAFDNLKEMNLGLHAKGDMAGFGFKAEADFQFGSVNDPKVKFSGLGLMAGVNFKVEPVNVRASAAYGSGDDKADDKQKEFQTFLTAGGAPGGSADQHYTFVYEYQVASTGSSKTTGQGIANTTYFNLGVDFNASKDMTASVDGYYLRANKTAHGISKSAGWEVDAKLKYSLAKNLSYQIDAGYFNAGDYYEDTFGSSKGATAIRHAITLTF